MSQDAVPFEPKKWWLIPARPQSFCRDCVRAIPTDSAASFCHESQEILCPACTGRLGITTTPSRRWLTLMARAARDETVLAVPCPRVKCAAGKGQRCIDVNKRLKTTPHAPRKRLAAEQAQRPNLRIVKDEDEGEAI